MRKPPDHPDEEAAAARRDIEQAKGAVMLVYSVDAEDAFAILRTASQDTNVKVREIAAAVVAELPVLGAPQNLDMLRNSLDHLLFANPDADARTVPDRRARGDSRAV